MTTTMNPTSTDPVFAASPEALGVPAATDEVTPFRLRVPDSVLEDLERRLSTTRWPEQEPVPDAT
jgi:hypothetical protein